MEFPINSISDLDKISSAAKWQYFEKLVAFIFDQNGYETSTGNVLKTSTGKMQIDVIAKKPGTIFLIECKKWRSRQRVSALKAAARRHAERCLEYGPSVPLIVTLLDDDVLGENGMHVVPISKLNWFLNENEAL